ncbi:MAG: hypothetical protein R2764_08345 [Bacteroidales bacterium]
MDFSSFSSIVEVLTVANFSYSGFKQVRNPLDETFESLPGALAGLDKYLDKKATKQHEIVDRLTLVNEEISESENVKTLAAFKLAQNLSKEKEKLRKLDDSINKYREKSNRVTATERRCHFFKKNLPPLYLMSALFGIYVLIFSAFQNFVYDPKSELPEGLSSSIFFFMIMISIFYFYIVISTFNVKRFKTPSSVTTLIIYLVLLGLFFASRINPWIIKSIINIGDFNISLFIIILTSFSFIFHFVRQIQIKTTYQVCRVTIFSRTLIEIYIHKIVINFMNKIIFWIKAKYSNLLG